MKTMTGLKLKFAASLAAGALLVGGLATVAVSETVKNNKPSAQAILKQSMETYSELTSYSDEGNIVSMIGSNRVAPHTFTTQLGRPNLYRIEWKQDSGFFVSKGMAWSEGKGDYVKILEQRKPELLENRDLVLDTATGISGGAASSVPRAFFESSGGNRFSATMSAAVREADEIAGGVDCYVLSQSTAGRKRRIWIGKQDHLIRQIENTTSAKVLKPLLEDAEKRRPQNQGPLPSSLVKGDSLSVETHTNIVVNAILTQKSFVP